MRGVEALRKNMKKEARGIIKKYLGIEIYISRVRSIEGGLSVELEFFEREQKVQRWLEKIAEGKRKNELEVRTGYMKIRVEGSWYYWNELVGQLESKKVVKTKETETWNYIRRFDIILLQDTWLEREKEDKVLGKLNQNFKWGTKPAITKIIEGEQKEESW
ncbi:hypothetical protein TSAR_013281 [Trichomalopsis sarcophagae]|uniref:Uncharacterized protein n=1 Tax=Trichomalopsis sarcophagae TaxID=543379 RepID=A0A232EIQ6_9HYME|nr:hypothetical protein TSAR_013281 [Trichomalopsis sarcophagae]